MQIETPWLPIGGVRKRASSYDRTGGNADFLTFEPGESKILLNHEGASGYVLRIWFTLSTQDPLYLQQTAISMSFDGEETVSTIPLGMFTATGPWAVNDLTSQPLSVMRSRMMNQDQAGVGCGSFNITWRMPFLRSCKIQIHNRSTEALKLFFYVDYLINTPVTDARDYFLFHATHHRNQYTTAQSKTQSVDATGNVDLYQGEGVNLSNQNNYIFAEINGYVGNYVGTILAVESHPDRVGKWYEGDDMFFVDGESWPPSLHGTGTEDYFGMAWGVHRPYKGWDHGVTHYERNITDHDRFYDGRFVLYRWHLADPIPFQKSLHASIEAGHANDCEQLYESVSFWYGKTIQCACR